MNDLVNILVNNGVAIALCAYYFIKDWRFNETLTKTLTMLETSIENLKEVIEKERDVYK